MIKHSKMPKPIIPANSPDLLARDGLTESIAPWEDGQRADTGRGSFEWWYFDAHFDDGSTAVIVYATKPLLERNGPLKPNVSLTITRPDGTKVSQFPIFPADQFSASRESCDVHIGPNWAQGDLHQYQVHAEMNGLAADLTFRGIVPPWRPGAGKVYFGDLDHYFAWLPSIPYGTVEGTLTYDGQIVLVKGTGYHDHNWGNVGLNEVMDHWYWGRAHLGEYTLIFVEQIASAKYGYSRMPVFMLAQGDQILIGESQPLTMRSQDTVPHPEGRGYPREVDFDWVSGGDSIHLRLRQPKLIEAVSLLLLLPKWQQQIAKLFANPYYFRFNANLELEIKLDSVQATEHGSALYEIMILQGKKHP
jgi:predicted secreted hydrolase